MLPAPSPAQSRADKGASTGAEKGELVGKKMNDGQLGKAEFDALLPILGDISPDRLQQVRIDLAEASIAVRRVADLVDQPEIKQRLQAVGGELDPRHLTNLRSLALAAWYVRTESESAGTKWSEAKVPMTLVNEAVAQKTRVFTYCEYWLGDDEEAAAELASIRAGTGYLDLSMDLSRLAKLVKKHQPLLAQDKKHYRSDDVTETNRLATAVHESLGTQEAKE